MTALGRNKRDELRRIHSMLETIYDLADHAELTETVSGGESSAVQRFNAALNRLVQIEIVPPDFFVLLSDGATWGELQSACAQLTGYLAPDVEDASPRGPALNSLNFQPQFHSPVTAEGIGALLREIMPEDAREAWEEEEEEIVREEVSLDDVESKIAELGGQMQALAERLHRNDLSSDDMEQLAQKLRDIGQAQTRLAQEHAKARERE